MNRFPLAGYELIPGLLTPSDVQKLIRTFECEWGRSGAPASVNQRNLLSIPAIRDLVASEPVSGLMRGVLGRNARAVRGILFDKTAQSNWKVPWHQDLSIAVREKVEVAGYGPWSVKEGVVHVQPPVEVLENMVTLRLHLDDCGPQNAPLRVLPGTHCLGKLQAAAIQAQRECTKEVCCEVGAGGALLMRPLLLHASSAAASPGHRRVIHLEFAAHPLPDGLDWYEQV